METKKKSAQKTSEVPNRNGGLYHMEQEKIDRLQWILDDAVARGEIPGAILMVRKEGKETVYLESG